jgi:transcription termination/antitermination protein NusA
MKSDFYAAISQISSERGVARELIVESIEAALISAYKRSFGGNSEVTVRVDPQTGEARVFTAKQVVEQVTDDKTEISLQAARAIAPRVQTGETVQIESTPRDFGRIAAQTAKQVVLQRIREAERDHIYDEYVDREGEIITGLIQRFEPRAIIMELGKAEAVLPQEEQVPTERYRLGQRLKVYLMEVHKTHRGPQIIVSRTHRNLLRRLFELEVPEVFNGTVDIKSIAREPGLRSKVAVAARQEGVDPVGSCVGMRGVRIQNIVNELYGEKIDVVQWNPDPKVFIANALSPAEVLTVELNDDQKTATVIVPERQLSLAIGKEGQNARLAAKLTGWRIDIKSSAATSEGRDADFARRAAESLMDEEAWALARPERQEQIDFDRLETRKVRKDGTISYRNTVIGPLPENLAGKTVNVKPEPDSVRIFWQNQPVGTFPISAPEEVSGSPDDSTPTETGESAG